MLQRGSGPCRSLPPQRRGEVELAAKLVGEPRCASLEWRAASPIQAHGTELDGQVPPETLALPPDFCSRVCCQGPIPRPLCIRQVLWQGDRRIALALG
jgi:hypothetical protein